MLGENIRKIRKSNKMSINTLSQKSGVSLGYLSDLENNKATKPSNETLDKIAETLGVSVGKLTGEAASSIIEYKLEELGMTLDELSAKSKVPLGWLKNLDSFTPGEADDFLNLDNPHELGWSDEIGGCKSYAMITEVAKVLGESAGRLISALARQEIPVYDGPVQTVQDAFKDFADPLSDENKENNPINTIAAHFKGKNISDEKLKRIEKFIEFTLDEDE